MEARARPGTGGRRWPWPGSGRPAHRTSSVGAAPAPDRPTPSARTCSGRRSARSGARSCARLASLEPGSAPDHTSLRERLAWRRPNRSAAVLDEAVEAVLRESEWLGVTGRGALSEAGRALVAPLLPRPPRVEVVARARRVARAPRTASAPPGVGAIARAGSGAGTISTEQASADAGAVAEAVAAAMSAHLPSPVDHILVQADLTAVAPGPLVGGLGSFMRLAADVESRGGATVYRFTPESVRRALDAGWTAADFTETVRRSSRTPVPQPLEYLVADVARKHGQTRIGGAAAYIRSDDEAVLDTMLASRDLTPCACDGSPRRCSCRRRTRACSSTSCATTGSPRCTRGRTAPSSTPRRPAAAPGHVAAAPARWSRRSTGPTPSRSSTGCARPRRRPTSDASRTRRGPARASRRWTPS